MDIAAWLRQLGLERYEQAFRENEVGLDVLPKLTAEDLKEIGVIPVGDRRRLLEAIAALAEPASPPQAESSTPAGAAARARSAVAERRQLTVLFCDLVGSTELSTRLDPEDMGAVIRRYQECCAEVVGHWDGHVAKYMGDGVLVYFGYPQAHEEDAERAVRAGLDLTNEVAQLGTSDDAPLAARVGVATGLVMVGDLIGEGAAQEEAVVGETPNLAARLQNLAEPGGVVIAPGTHRLLAGLFEYADLGAHDLKGFAKPIQAWRVLDLSGAESRFEALRGRGVTPLIGRDEEFHFLLSRWRQAMHGEGQVVLLSGEPGIGKSRITQALLEQLADQSLTRLRYYGSPYHTNSALHPIIAQLERAAGFAPDDAAAIKLDKLEAVLGRASERVAEVAPLLAALLSIPSEGRYPPLNLTPQAQKAQTFDALIDQLTGLAAGQPVLTIFEDAHWIDPTTAELIGLMINRTPRLPVLLLITHRPEFTPPWTGHTHVASVALTRLGQHQSAAMIERLTAGKPLPAEVLGQILARTDGVPLFVEELTKTVLESGMLTDAGDHYELGIPVPELAIPATLHDSLMARLDRLAPIKEIAQIGAVIGREFSHTLLAAVADRPEPELAAAVDRLVSAELIFRRGKLPNVSYSFKHGLVQDTAYQSLLKSKRQQLHARIGMTLEDRFPEIAAAQPEVLAHHLTEAGRTERAIPYWRDAAERSAERSAFREAAAQINQGLAVLGSLPDPTERRSQELGLRLVLGSVLTAMKGPAAAEVGQTYARARSLCRETDHAELFAATWNLWHCHAHGPVSQLEDARRLAEELLTIAQQRSDPGLLLQAHHAAWTTCFRLPGMLATCRDHAERGVELYDRSQHRSHRFVYGGHDPGVCCRYVGAWAWWLLGFPDRAIARATEAVDLAQDLSHPFSTILAQSFVCYLHFCRREPELTRKSAGAAMAVCAEQGIAPHYLAGGRILQGWALAVQGEAQGGLAEVREGLGALRSTGTTLNWPFMLAVLAEVCGCAGQLDQGLDAVAEALDALEETGERLWEAEIYRRKGLLLAAKSQEHWPQAEVCYRQAVEVARAQGVKSLELRAAISFAQLWRDQGKRGEAHDLLAPVYDCFTEGFDTADLKDARALLDGLR